MSTKGCSGFFLFYLDLELFAKIKKDLFRTHSQKPSLSISQDLDLDISEQEPCPKSQQKILNSMVVGARESFQFFRQITRFLGNNGALSKFVVNFALLNWYYQIRK